MLDTSVAIHLRDGEASVLDRVFTLQEALMLSIVSVVELEAGVMGAQAAIRRQRLDILLDNVSVRAFGRRESDLYGEIVRAVGYSRRKVLDRMIAAQAIAANATLVTLNGADFRDVPDLRLLEW